ncbi:preprotein translocase subunit YajC [Magnetovibrio sp. PR-2]|uniref:preprotein translocase subunit YajC n=1 Tax=Magnetovibrio sp. PR-2 TaxID=3120356 RepID=UPI002FCE241C
MLISEAYAQAAGGAGGGDLFAQLMPLVLIFVVFYFLLIRPQQQRMKKHKEMLGTLRRGDKVVTGGGIVAKVTKVREDNDVELEIADGVKITVVRDTIATVEAKTEAADSAGSGGDKGEGEKKGGLKKLLGG